MVIPSPTRSFNLHKDANLYYEVYNLKLDEFGQAKYRVTYTIHPNVAGSTTVAGVVIGGLRRLFAGAKEPEFTISYERVVNATDEPVFFALETESLKPGLKMVEVGIEDLNSGTTCEPTGCVQCRDVTKTLIKNHGVGTGLKP